jgi:hypothetical protein
MQIKFQPYGNYFSYGVIKGKKEPKGERHYPNGPSQRTKRRYNSLKYQMDALYEDPRHFITLNCPENDIKKAIHNFNKLRSRLREKFNNCWFIWKLEFNHGFLHFHLIGDFGEKHDIINYQDWVMKRWEKIWKNLSENSVRVDYIYQSKEDIAKSKNYLTKNEKFKSDKKLVEMLGRNNNFGAIQKKNAPIAHERILNIDTEFFNKKLKPVILEDLNRQQFDDENDRQARIEEVKKSNYNRHKFYDPDLRKKFYKRLKKYSSSIK